MSEDTNNEKKDVVTSEEAELLGQEEDILDKKESGENLSADETETLEKINTLKGDLKTRLGKDTPDKPKEEFASIDAQKRHFKKKFNTSEERRLKAVKDLEDFKKSKETSTTTEEKTEWQKKIDFVTSNKEVTKEELNYISTVAKGKDISLDEAHKSKEVQDYLNYRREKVKNEGKVPHSSPASSTGTDHSPQEIGEMSREDHQKLALDNIKKQKGGNEV